MPSPAFAFFFSFTACAGFTFSAVQFFEMPNNVVYSTKNICKGDRDKMHFIFLDFVPKERAIMNNSEIMLRLLRFSSGEQRSLQLGELRKTRIAVARSLSLKVTSLLFLHIYNVELHPTYCSVSHVGQKDQLHTDLEM